jgi:Protein of unknown function (DUF4012)
VTRRRVLLACVALLVLLVASGTMVMILSARDLQAATSVLERPAEEVTQEDISVARAHLGAAQERLSSVPARVLEELPLVGANVGAAKAVAEASSEVLDAGQAVADYVANTDDAGLIDAGAVDQALLRGLKEPLERQLDALRGLQATVGRHRTGSLAPPLWNALDQLLGRTRALAEGTEESLALLRVARGLLGGAGLRRYLVTLVNNAELRGSGGILAGVGTLEVSEGKLRLGRFYSVHELAQHPPEEVPAPAVYERRFGSYEANTTLWLNATFSPDFPDVALVASRLFQHVTGVRTDGVLQIDPVALAALLPAGSTIEIPRLDVELDSEQLPGFVYSGAYQQFKDQVERRDALLEVGKKAFESVLDQGLGGTDRLAEVGHMIGAGHIRFATFDPQEEAALEASGVAGRVAPVEGDSVLVTVQNFGSRNEHQGTKLDYWARRSIGHACRVSDGGPTECVTTVTLRNEVPPGLPEYVAGSPYGLLRSYLEVYVPAKASLLSVEQDGAPVEFRDEVQAGRRAVGVFVEEPPGASATVETSYELPPRDAYTLQVLPQPLAVDAWIDLSVELPDGWVVDDPALGDGDDDIHYDGSFDRRLEVGAEPSDRTGLAALWEAIEEFWREPLF